MVVLTQNNRCKIIPRIKSITQVKTNEDLYARDKKYPATIVIITSTIAILKIRYEWTPSPGTPNEFLYLHKLI
jgi:hypothetical protein